MREASLEKILLFGFFLSGYAALTYEQIWIHLLTLIYGGSTYSYSILLGAFLFGLGMGSYVFGKLADRIEKPILALGWIELGVAFFALAVLPLFEQIDIFYLRLLKMNHPFTDLHRWIVPALWIGLTSFLIIPTSLLGAKFPVAGRIYSNKKRTRGRDMGALFASNTLGAVFAGWWAGFVFIPKIGLENTYLLASLSNFTFAALIFGYLLSSDPGLTKSTRGIVYTFNIIFILLLIPFAGHEVDTRFAGAYYIAPDMEIDQWIALKKDTKILFNRYSPFGMITVGEDGGVKYLSIDGKPEASNGPLDLDGQYLLGYLPLFAHSNPSKALHIGVGAGFTLDAIRNFPLEQIDAVEINPLLLEASKRYFSEESNNVFSDPRINLIVGLKKDTTL